MPRRSFAACSHPGGGPPPPFERRTPRSANRVTLFRGWDGAGSSGWCVGGGGVGVNGGLGCRRAWSGELDEIRERWCTCVLIPQCKPILRGGDAGRSASPCVSAASSGPHGGAESAPPA